MALRDDNTLATYFALHSSPHCYSHWRFRSSSDFNTRTNKVRLK